MKPEIKQLLQHEDHANRLIGCWLAWHDGYGTIDIFDNLSVKSLDNRISYRVGKYVLIITKSIERRCYPKRPSKSTRFNLIELSSAYLTAADKPAQPNITINQVSIKTDNRDSKSYQETFNHFKHMFIEYILSE